MKHQVGIDPYLDRCAEFLNEIGLRTRFEAGASGFTPGVQIRAGKVFVDPLKASASELLHEAGHLAVTPGRFRHLMNDDLQAGQARMFQEVEEANIAVDSPLYRAVMQSSETEATAWAWAVGKHLGIPDELIIKDEDYQGDGAIVRLQLCSQAYLGINGMSHSGFCVVREALSRIMGLPVFPNLKFWLQP